jgi:threonine/homoserine/homoserine lactone efflux protein
VSGLVLLIGATSVLVIIPGPNVALIVANSLSHGLRAGIATVTGTTVGVGLQLLLVVFGLAALVEFAAEALAWIKWAGVVYLVYLGIKAWREPPGDLTAIQATPVMFWRGCLVALLNPKTLLFNAAFIPQFVGGSPMMMELGIVALIFLSVLFVGDVLWAAFANTARRYIGRFGRLRNRVTGAFLGTAGVGLALSHR